MTKLTFQMTADEFYEGWKYKLKKNNYKNRLPIMIIILIILIIVTIAITKSTMFIFVFHHSFNDISKDYE